MAKSEHESEKQASDNEEGQKEKEAATPKEKKWRPDILYGKGEYRILGKKGEGTFSEVLKCQNIKDGTYWACKKMKQTYDSLEQVNNLREIQAMRRLASHSNILELQEVIFDKKSGTLVLILELMDMNIYELIRGKRHYLPERKVKNYMYQLIKSVEHMHRNGIFHRDVKPENILIKEDVLKLADFGSCRSVYSKQPYTEYISTRWYRAPECLLTDGYYTYKMDMWSVGCVFFEILSLHPLFPGANEVDQIAKIHDIMGTPDASVLNKLKKSRGMNFNFPSKKGSGIERMLQHASTDAIDLIYKMCTYDPDERMTAKQALRHPYFKELRIHLGNMIYPKPYYKEPSYIEMSKSNSRSTLIPVSTLSALKYVEKPSHIPVKTQSTMKYSEKAALPPVKTQSTMKHSEKATLIPVKTQSTMKYSENSALNPVKTPSTLKHSEKKSQSTYKSYGKRENDKRQAAIARAKQEKVEQTNAIPTPDNETSRSEVYEKKKDSELHLIASLPKPQSLPAHQLFKDKRKVYQRRRRLVDNQQTTYNTNHTGFFPKVPLHASTINPSYHASSFPSTFSTHNTSNQLSLLPSISSTYKTHKTNPSKQTKNMFSHYQLPSLDRRGAGF